MSHFVSGWSPAVSGNVCKHTNPPTHTHKNSGHKYKMQEVVYSERWADRGVEVTPTHCVVVCVV